jgi:hypothetical protein
VEMPKKYYDGFGNDVTHYVQTLEERTSKQGNRLIELELEVKALTKKLKEKKKKDA